MTKTEELLSVESDQRDIAAQLRLPSGPRGRKVADKMNEVNRVMIELAYAAIEVQPSDVVLEIGFGNGKTLGQITALLDTGKLFGIDMSETMIAAATESNASAIERGLLSLTLGSTKQLPFDSNYFDKIVTVNTLYFWSEPLNESQEIYRVLKPGGKFVVAIRSGNTMKNAPFTQFGFTLYESEEAVQLFRDAGFKNVSIQKYPDGEMEDVILSATK